MGDTLLKSSRINEASALARLPPTQDIVGPGPRAPAPRLAPGEALPPLLPAQERAWVASLQRAHGNRATAEMLSRDSDRSPKRGPSSSGGLLQAKLISGQAADHQEREADAAAERVMGPPDDHVGARRESLTAPAERRDHPSSTDELGLGRAIDASVRATLEPHFGFDFGEVRIHTDARAARAADRLSARAFTLGREVVFGEGEYRPHVREGRQLLAHELAHVVQQQHGSFVQRKARPATAPQALDPLGATLDPDDRNTIVFSRPVDAEEARRYLELDQPGRGALEPLRGDVGGDSRVRRFRLRFTSTDQALRLPYGLGAAYVQASLLRSKARSNPPLEQQFPPWVPATVKAQILALEREGKLSDGARFFAGQAPWGQILVWVGADEFRQRSIQLFYEYPSTLDFYLSYADGDRRQAKTLLDAHRQYNRDIRFFVEDEGLSVEDARQRIREVNAEVFKLVVMAAVMILQSGAVVSAVRLNAPVDAVPLPRGATRTATTTRAKESAGATLEDAAAVKANEAQPRLGPPTRGGIDPGSQQRFQGYLEPFEEARKETKEIRNAIQELYRRLGSYPGDYQARGDLFEALIPRIREVKRSWGATRLKTTDGSLMYGGVDADYAIVIDKNGAGWFSRHYLDPTQAVEVIIDGEKRYTPNFKEGGLKPVFGPSP